MKSLYLTFEDEDFNELKELRDKSKCKNWELYILRLAEIAR